MASVSLGFAMIVKPSIFPYTLFMIIMALLCSVVYEWYEHGGLPSLKISLLMLGDFFLVLFLIILPFYFIAGNSIVDYINRVLLQEFNIWAYSGTNIEHFFYYLVGEGGNTMLGNYLYFIITLVVLGYVVNVKLKNKSKVVHLLLISTQIVASWVLITIPRHKTPYLGSTFFFLVLFLCVVIITDIFSEKWVLGLKVKFPPRLAVFTILLIISICLFQWPLKWGDKESPRGKAIAEVTDNLLHALFSSEREPKVVYFTATGLINGDLIEYERIKGDRHTEIYYLPYDFSANHDLWNQRFDEANTVIACQSGTQMFVEEHFQSGQQLDYSLQVLQVRPDYAEVGFFTTHSGKGYYLFEKVDDSVFVDKSKYLMTIHPDLHNIIKVPKLTKAVWGIEHMNNKEVLWLGDLENQGLTAEFWAESPGIAEINFQFSPGPSRSDTHRNILVSIDWITDIERDTVSKSWQESIQISEPGVSEVSLNIEFQNGWNRFEVSVLDEATIDVLPNGETRHLMVMLHKLDISLAQ
jgi:hypothetical protein